jgi:hypothetical protein
MSANSSPPLEPKNDYPKDSEKVALGERDASLECPASPSIGEGEDILGRQDIDPALNAKMHLVNNVRTHSQTRQFAPS